ncbi:hypothetical protein F0U59_07760 [Archangium gephyra]|nr:hypothetical protein F0U59_07760 [Archangium gephyra]
MSTKQMRLAAVVGGALVLSGTTGCNQVGKWVKDQRYSPLVPPTTLLGPGTIVHALGNDWKAVGIVCTQKASLGAFTPVESASKSETLKRELKSSFSLDGDYLDVIKADAKFKSLREIDLKLEDIKVYELSWDQVFDNLPNRSDGCKQALQTVKQDPNMKYSMITSVIQANVTYDVKFENSGELNAEAKQELLQNLAAKLGVSASDNSTSTMRGAGLFWGMRDNSTLAKLEASTPKAPPAFAEKSVEGDRLVPVQFLQVQGTPMAGDP